MLNLHDCYILILAHDKSYPADYRVRLDLPIRVDETMIAQW